MMQNEKPNRQSTLRESSSVCFGQISPKLVPAKAISKLPINEILEI